MKLLSEFNLVTINAEITLLTLPREYISTANRSHPEYTCHLIRKVSSMHDLLSDTVDQFNHCYCFQAVHALTVVFSFTIFTIFSLIHAYAGNVNEASLRVAWTNAMYDGFFLILAFQMIVMAAKVNETVGKASVPYLCKHSALVLWVAVQADIDAHP